jgi:cytochrome c biogenesis protein CcdA/thiol-disulfide isomerase/thioredoxin
MTLFVLSIIAGMLTVLAPCILPLLPIVLGGSVADTVNKRRPFVIVASLGASIFLFTFLLKASTIFIGVPEIFWKYFAAAIIAVFGLALLFPRVWEGIVVNIPGLHTGGNTLLAKGYQSRAAWWGDMAIGVALGPIFTTCSPTYFLVLATVLPVSFLKGSVYIAAYVLGLAIVLLGIAALGQRLVAKLNWAANPEGWFKRIMGLLFLLVALAIATGADKKIESAILNAGFFDVTKLEQAISQCLEGRCARAQEVFPFIPAGAPASTPQQVTRELTGNDVPTRAVEFKDPSGFVNSEPFQLADVIGKKVILLDFMTYSCINCQRTFPYLNDWYESYMDQGLEIVGVHTPEFAFEKKRENVIAAAKQFGLQFPLVMDNEYATWNAYRNRYWPRKYLIDIYGDIIYDHIGEGDYEKTEVKIVEALNERKRFLNESNMVNMDRDAPANIVTASRSPETYFGAWRNEAFGNGQPFWVGEDAFRFPVTIQSNRFYLDGRWEIANEFAASKSQSSALRFRFDAKDVYLVAEASESVTVNVLIDGKPVDTGHAGKDVHDGNVTIDASRLYHVYTSDVPSAHVLELVFRDEGGRIYALTFG